MYIKNSGLRTSRNSLDRIANSEKFHKIQLLIEKFYFPRMENILVSEVRAEFCETTEELQSK